MGCGHPGATPTGRPGTSRLASSTAGSWLACTDHPFGQASEKYSPNVGRDFDEGVRQARRSTGDPPRRTCLASWIGAEENQPRDRTSDVQMGTPENARSNRCTSFGMLVGSTNENPPPDS